ncbi:MAG: hypothetical protein ACP5HH_07195 [Fervidicoccaceae archaeon]
MAVLVYLDKTNYYWSYDLPAYLHLKTDETVQLKAYEIIDSTTFTYIDDVTAGTTRTGEQIIKLWDYNPHGSLPSSLITGYITVEIYESGNLVSTKTLPYYYGPSAITFRFYDKNTNAQVSGNVSYYITQPYSFTVYFMNYTNTAYIPFVPTSANKSNIEFAYADSYVKYYYTSPINVEAGTYNVLLDPFGPNDEIPVVIGIDVTKDLYAYIMNDYLSYTLANSTAFNIMWNNFSANKSAQFLFATNFFDKFGIKVLITDIEATMIDQNTVHLDIYANQDLAPIILALIVIAIITGIVMAPFIINAINNLTITLTKKSVDTALLQYVNTINTLKAQAMNQCLSLTDPTQRQQCLNDVNKAYSSLPTTSQIVQDLNNTNTTLSNQLDNQKKETDKWKLVALASLGLTGGALLTRERK